jgi:hypothetical protein
MELKTKVSLSVSLVPPKPGKEKDEKGKEKISRGTSQERITGTPLSP